jgi:hypothetical protein
MIEPHVMGLPRWALGVRARSLRFAAPPLVAGWAAGRGSCGRSGIVRKVRLSALVASLGDPASRDESYRVRRS